jgi:segregation and condensation protein B
MSLKSQIEAIIYAAEEPVTIEQMATVLKATIAVEPPAEGEDRHKSEIAQVRSAIRGAIDELANEYALNDRGMEIRQVAGGYRMSTKPEHHDVVRAFARSLKPPVRLSLQALETLAVIAYKQPITVPEISEIRGVDSGGVIATLLDRKLITTAGRKAVIGRPILYKTTKDFLLRFGLKDVSELPSIEEFEKLAAVGSPQAEIFESVPDATGVSTSEPDTQPGEESQESVRREAVPDDDEPVFASMADDYDEPSAEEPGREVEPVPDPVARN